MSTTTSHWLPHGPKLDLVRLGLDPNSTVDDFARWRESLDFESMDWAFAELLPLVAERFGSDDGRIQGLRRRNFYVNTIAFTRINEAIDRLTAAGIASVLGGGLAAINAYPNPSCRSLPDAELIVSSAQYERALALLADVGDVVRPTPRLRGTAQGYVVDTVDIPSTITTLLGRPLPIITPIVAVVEIAVAAVWPDENPPVRWVVDLELLLSKLQATSDINAIVAHARAHDAAHLVRVALQQARGMGATSVPRRLLRKLALAPVTRFERNAVIERTGSSLWKFYKERL